jgi:hypothetical protein
MGKRAAQAPSLEKLHVRTCPSGANGAINRLWREMLQALLGRQHDPLVCPSHVLFDSDEAADRARGAEGSRMRNGGSEIAVRARAREMALGKG